jgi:hypothetical protein
VPLYSSQGGVVEAPSKMEKGLRVGGGIVYMTLSLVFLGVILFKN